MTCFAQTAVQKLRCWRTFALNVDKVMIFYVLYTERSNGKTSGDVSPSFKVNMVLFFSHL